VENVQTLKYVQLKNGLIMFLSFFIPFLHNELCGFLRLKLHTEHYHFELVTSGFYYYLKKATSLSAFLGYSIYSVQSSLLLKKLAALNLPAKLWAVLSQETNKKNHYHRR